MHRDRIAEKYRNRIISAEQAAELIKDGMVVGASGFTKAGDAKATLKALVEKAKKNPLKINLMTGASLGHNLDGLLAEADVIARRMPFQADPLLRKKINTGDVMFTDPHLGETAELLAYGFLPSVDIAVIEVAAIYEDGSILPTTSVGNNLTYARHAKSVILEVNTTIPLEIRGFHDIFATGLSPHRQIIPVTEPSSRIGTETMDIDPAKIAGIVISDIKDSPVDLSAVDVKTQAISDHLMDFFNQEVKKGRLSMNLPPLQTGIGNIANAVFSGFKKGNFENLQMYSEVLQDSTFELIDSGKMKFASACSFAVTEGCYEKFFANLDQYRGKVLLRPEKISNSPEVIRRLGVIAINTAIEFDLYGNVNSTHIGGNKLMNGIGGSGDFARNSYLSIFVTQSASKNNNISHVVPMVTHVDSNEHDVDILVTDQGLADLRGLAPRERALRVIESCVHPEYRDQLKAYYKEALARGGHTPHVIERAFAWHQSFNERGTMKLS
ncbi:acetyl-CoA hydrolase/transferase family protein [Bdellovibrio bacteriovorus]|uniref:Acetyl-CoA hydrolase/transferase family protein n=1 Tax=Bdellovibrio bacteriovorus str. Tiberius TaxID=1069642 RepID=K7ZF10_BDEBC|nr:acetyl-CoA hydrolase/transferase family protein [Bdellovibrio bacteriovorus]AFY01027.1 acetyl-CoA hydrolase/transferase family protein [Bdellovibrio bacteriovorus str. Tiberius]